MLWVCDQSEIYFSRHVHGNFQSSADSGRDEKAMWCDSLKCQLPTIFLVQWGCKSFYSK